MAKDNKKSIETLIHKDASRRNIPTAEYQSVMHQEEQSPIRVAYERRNRDLDPQLVWRGKDEQDWSDLVVQAPPLYIQEKVHPKVLIDDLMRETRKQEGTGQPRQLNLFADFNGLPSEGAKTEFYQHDANWSNRMILGDSLQVMASLAEREGLRGQVQCIYIDPPYGIKFNSNFQWSTTSRDVKDGNSEHITREPEQVKAFRDTWRDGIHSYLTYLRDRLTVARDLLADSGSIFVQIGDENVHRVRALMDEVLGEENFVSVIVYAKTTGFSGLYLSSVTDHIIWYARNRERLKFRALYSYKHAGDEGASKYRPASTISAIRNSPFDVTRLATSDQLTSQGESINSEQEFDFRGKLWMPPSGLHWKTTVQGLVYLSKAGRLIEEGRSIRYVRCLDDFPIVPQTNVWLDIGGVQSRTDPKVYVVQTATEAVKRCTLMTTDPGDLVLDPTCGSGTTAYVAEQWGRRWITIDTSRVALALARARIMGTRYPYYLLADSRDGQIKEAEIIRKAPSEALTHGNIRQGFVYERVPHITLKSIANNAEIDVIWEKYQEVLEPLRKRLNKGLGKAWEEWEIPRDLDNKWSKEAKEIHSEWWMHRIARQKEIDASIAAKADFEYLYDKPYEDKKKVRVSGPFTVESLSPHRVLGVDENDELIDGVSESEAGFGDKRDFVRMILENLKTSGVQQAHKEDKISFNSIAPWPGDLICAEGRYVEGDEESGTEKRAAIFIGPEFGTVSRPDLVSAAREAGDAGFDALIACAFNYDAHSTDFEKLGRLPVLKARMNADLHMVNDLKNTGKGNLFVIFGEPDIEVVSGQWLVTSGGRMVAHYDSVKELSGLGSLEEINRLGRESLPSLKGISPGGAVRTNQPGSKSSGVGPGEHRGGSGKDKHGGISAESEHSQGISSGSGNASDLGESTGHAGRAHVPNASEGGGRTGANARRAQAVAAVQTLKAGDFPLKLTTQHFTQITIHGVDVFHPTTGEVRSDGAEGIACWFIDTDYNEESFFVRHAYFLGASDPYKSLKTTLKAEINEEAWESLNSDTSRPFQKPASGRIAVKVINHLGDEVMKVFRV